MSNTAPNAMNTQPIQGVRPDATSCAPPIRLNMAQAKASHAASQFENARHLRKNSPTSSMVARRALRRSGTRADNLIRMRVSDSRTQPVQAPTQPAPNAADQLRAALLRRLLEAQQEQADQLTREAEGKGTILDIRV